MPLCHKHMAGFSEEQGCLHCKMENERRQEIIDNAEKIRKGDTDICQAIDLLTRRVKMLDSDELFEREGHSKNRIPLEEKWKYEDRLYRALIALTKAESFLLEKRSEIRINRKNDPHALDWIKGE